MRGDRVIRRPQRPVLFWTVFSLVALLSVSAIVFLKLYG